MRTPSVAQWLKSLDDPVSHTDGQRILDVVVYANGWGTGRCYRHVIELPTIIIEWE